jgi:hypothetical protein
MTFFYQDYGIGQLGTRAKTRSPERTKEIRALGMTGWEERESKGSLSTIEPSQRSSHGEGICCQWSVKRADKRK